MKTEINPTSQSKIAHTAAIQSTVNIVVYMLINRGVIPQDASVDALVVGNTISGVLIYVFRRWFTTP